MKNFIKKHPVTTYFTIAFGWTWAIVFAIILSGQAEDITNPTPFFIIGGIICNISPSLAAFTVSRISEGKEGVRKLKEGFVRKSPAKLYVLAILTVPAITALSTLISHYTVRPYQLSVTIPMIVMGLVWPLFSSHGEEFGWRGYILPKLLARFAPLKSAVMLGIVWSAWHLPMYYMAYKDFGSYMIPAFLTIGFINLTLQTVIMTFLYMKSKGSIRLMILYHYTITSSSILLGAFFKTVSTPRLTVMESIVSVGLFAAFAAILWLKDSKRSKSIQEVKGMGIL